MHDQENEEIEYLFVHGSKGHIKGLLNWGCKLCSLKWILSIISQMTCLRSLKLYLKPKNVRVYVGICKWRRVKAEKGKETLRQAYVHRTRAIVEQFSLILKQICVCKGQWGHWGLHNKGLCINSRIQMILVYCCYCSKLILWEAY